MGGDSFRFKQFVVHQALSAMKVGTDGVLLGSWVALNGGDRSILDIGTGTGLVALMVAQRSDPAAQVDAVEIESAAAREAIDNVARSPWSSKIKIMNIDFQSFAAASDNLYDVIVSNPPYFNGSYKSKIVERTAARHSELLNSDDLLAGVARILDRERGCFSAIFPYENAAVFIAKAASVGLFCNRMLEIYPKPSSLIKRIVAEFSFSRQVLVTERLYVLDDQGQYTPEFRVLTADFYLKF